MSFFNDFLKSFEINDAKNELIVSMIIGIGLKIIGNVHILKLNENEILLTDKKHNYKIVGEKLKLVEIAKGEISVQGDINGFVGC